MNKHNRWHPYEDVPADKAALEYLKSRAKNSSANEKKCIIKALAKIEEWQEGSQEQQAAAWYYAIFCQAWGYAVKKGGSISTKRGWICPSSLESHLGLEGKEPHYMAIRPSKWVGWAAIDIDKGSRYHFGSETGEGIEPIKEALSDIGFQSCIEFQSSTSGGIHLWYPLATLTPAKNLARGLEDSLLSKGLEIRNGVLEIRPNRKQFKSDYLMLRAPLTGEGNMYWEPAYGDFGFHDELRLFHQLWMERQKDNHLRPLQEKSQRNPTLPPNRRRQTGSKKSLKEYQERLVTGFTAKGQSQELKLSSLVVARLIEGIDSYIELKKRAHELLENMPGFNQYCSHRNEIRKRTYITKNELIKCLQMAPGGYANTWKEESNLKRAKIASEAALDAIEKVLAEGMRFKSSNKAIKYLQAQGGPSRSWWLNPSNKEFLQLVKRRLVEK